MGPWLSFRVVSSHLGEVEMQCPELAFLPTVAQALSHLAAFTAATGKPTEFSVSIWRKVS
jgi:hypothetical protein